jgi:hypothetical protein
VLMGLWPSNKRLDHHPSIQLITPLRTA